MGRTVPRGEEADVAARPHVDALADAEHRHGSVHQGLVLLAEAHVDRGRPLDRGREEGADLEGVAWRQNRHPGERAERGDVLESVVGRPQRGIGETRPDPDDHHGSPVVAEVDAHLLQHLEADEGGDAVDHGPEPRERHPRGHPHHVGLGHAAVEEPLGMGGLERVEQPVADVPGEQHDPLVQGGEAIDLVGKGVPHDAASSSIAAAISPASGIR